MSFCGSASRLQQLGDADQVVGGSGEGEAPPDALEPSVAGLAQAARDLDPAERLLDPLADALAQGVAGMPRGSTVDGRGPVRVVLGDVRGYVHLPQIRHMLGHVEGLVRAE